MGETFIVTSRHAEDTADGRVFGPGEKIDDLDLSDPHNQQMVDDGRIVSLKADKAASKASKSKEGASS